MALSENAEKKGAGTLHCLTINLWKWPLWGVDSPLSDTSRWEGLTYRMDHQPYGSGELWWMGGSVCSVSQEVLRYPATVRFWLIPGNDPVLSLVLFDLSSCTLGMQALPVLQHCMHCIRRMSQQSVEKTDPKNTSTYIHMQSKACKVASPVKMAQPTQDKPLKAPSRELLLWLRPTSGTWLCQCTCCSWKAFLKSSLLLFLALLSMLQTEIHCLITGRIKTDVKQLEVISWHFQDFHNVLREIEVEPSWTPAGQKLTEL